MSGGEFLETGESIWCISCGHHLNDHIPSPSDSPPNFFYYAREYLGCKDWCYCKKFTPYKIDPRKSKTLLEENTVTQTEKQDKENTESTPK